MGFTKKYEFQDGEIVRYKIRLRAEGYAKKEDIGYNKVFSLVVKHSWIRILLALIAKYDLELDRLNLKTPFLHDDHDVEMYMTHQYGSKLQDRKN